MSLKRLVTNLARPVRWSKKRQSRHQIRQDSLGRVKAFSFPRSGTHFLEAFIGRNFYHGQDLHVGNVEWGHWSSMQLDKKGNTYGKLFGSHNIRNLRGHNLLQPSIYIYRDPRAVAYSIWRTPYFLNKDLNGISFADFVGLKLDWRFSPNQRVEPTQTLAEQWYEHVHTWLSRESDNILCIRYEDLVAHPEDVYRQIADRFFPKSDDTNERPVNEVREAVGLMPNQALPETWRDVFTPELESQFMSYLPDRQFVNYC